MLTRQQIQRAHALSCGSRIYKECRFDDCVCACHDEGLWDYHLDMLDMESTIWPEDLLSR